MKNIDEEFCFTDSAEEHIAHARSYCFSVAQKYWKTIRSSTGVSWYIRPFRNVQLALDSKFEATACSTALRLSQLEPAYAGYELASQYMDLLPKNYRVRYGIYYTPINVVNAMIDEAKHNGINLKTARIIDTSSGGSAFLAPLCR